MAEEWLEHVEAYAWLAEDSPGKAGICAAVLPGIGACPGVCLTLEAAKSMEPLMRMAAARNGKRAYLVKLRLAEVLEEA